MILDGYTTVPSGATVGGAPVDAYQADSFRKNDAFFEKWLQAIMVSPLIPSGSLNSMIVTEPKPHEFINARRIVVEKPVSFPPDQNKIPIIWFASESIIIRDLIDVSGKGAQPGEDGDFGGSGGFGAVDGKNCVLPNSNVVMVPGGTASSKFGTSLNAEWASRALPLIAYCKGGAAGGDDTAPAGSPNRGGAGGGVVVLCAPLIKFEGVKAKIEAKGMKGSGGNTGGGGGGLVVLLARKIITGGVGRVSVIGGAKQSATSAKGGNGHLLKVELK